MQFVVTAGNTWAMLDRVRCVTNIFTGRTGASIAIEAFRRGHEVTLLTSHPETAGPEPSSESHRWNVIPYRTFEELAELMKRHIGHGRPDVVIHSAAVSDYLADGVFTLSPGGAFDAQTGTISGPAEVHFVDRREGKVKSDEPELWIRMVQAPKLVDRIRGPWGFSGTLVKFKLEVGRNDDELLAVAERSRRHSDADWIVANTLESAADWALIGSERGYEKVARSSLPGRLLDCVESCSRGGKHG